MSSKSSARKNTRIVLANDASWYSFIPEGNTVAVSHFIDNSECNAVNEFIGYAELAIGRARRMYRALLVKGYKRLS